MFVSDRSETPQIWLLPTDMGEATQLTDLSTGVSDPRWSPDGQSILFASDVYPEWDGDDQVNQSINEGLSEGPLQAHMADSLLFRHWNAYRDGQVTHTLCVELESGEMRDLTPGSYNSPPFSLGGDAGYALSPDGQELCFVSKRVPNPAESTNNDVFVVAVDGGEPRNITAANEAYDGDVQYSPNGHYIAYRTQRIPGYESDRFRLAIYDRKTQKTTVLTEQYDNHIASYVWAPDSQSLYAVTEERGYSPLYQVQVPSGTMHKIDQVNALAGVTLSPDGQWLVYSDRRVGSPTELYRSPIQDQAVEQLTFVNQEIVDTVDIRPSEQLWVEGAGGTQDPRLSGQTPRLRSEQGLSLDRQCPRRSADAVVRFVFGAIGRSIPAPVMWWPFPIPMVPRATARTLLRPSPRTGVVKSSRTSSRSHSIWPVWIISTPTVSVPWGGPGVAMP